MNYEVYRNTTLGNTLQEVLDDLVQVRKVKKKIYKKYIFSSSQLIQLCTRVNLILIDSILTEKINEKYFI